MSSHNCCFMLVEIPHKSDLKNTSLFSFLRRGKSRFKKIEIITCKVIVWVLACRKGNVKYYTFDLNYVAFTTAKEKKKKIINQTILSRVHNVSLPRPKRLFNIPGTISSS